jgi:hypothetical protein
VPGGFLIIHDYGSLAWAGAEKAIDAFFADKPECVVQIPDSCGSAVVRKMRPPGGELNWLQKQQYISIGEWHPTKNGGLSASLTQGWAGPENWGVWGVGNTHEMTLVIAEQPEKDIVIELDTAAALAEGRPEQVVEVDASKNHIATLHFSAIRNRAVHQVTIPFSLFQRSAAGAWTVRLEFKPRHVASIAELDPAKSDNRALGLALYRLRRAT